MTTNPKQKLAACPFCGALARMERDENIFALQHYPNYPGQTHGFRVECAGSCHSMTCWWHTEDEATEAWNRRVEASPAIPSGEQWRPIETCPDSDDEILVCYPKDSGRAVELRGAEGTYFRGMIAKGGNNMPIWWMPIPSLETPDERQAKIVADATQSDGGAGGYKNIGFYIDNETEDS